MNSNSIDDYFILPIAIHRNIKVHEDTKGVENIFWNAKTSINSEIERLQHNNTIYDKKRLETLNKLKNEPTKQVNCIITKTYTNIDSLTNILGNTRINIDEENTKKLIFQSFYAVYIMRTKLKMVHYDLHFGNILVKYRKEPYLLTYDLNNKYYYMESNYKLRIYDFDRGYISKQDNDLNYFCTKYSICNKLSNHDIYYLIFNWREKYEKLLYLSS